MAKKPIIRYFDRGVWYDATVSDIGNLEELNTVHKTTVVEAINDIVGGNFAISGDLLNRLNGLDESIAGLDEMISNGALNGNQAEEINQFIVEKLNELNQSMEELNKQREQRLKEQEEKVAQLRLDSESDKQRIEEITGDLSATKEKLNNAELNVTSVKQLVDEINGKISQTVSKTDFDLLEGTVREQKTLIDQTAEGIKLLATKEELDKSNEDVKSIKSEIEVQAGLIESKVSSEQLINEMEKIDKYMPNLLRYTRNWHDWENNDEANIDVTLNEYRDCIIQRARGIGKGLSTTVEDLVIGETYSLSVWVKHDDTNAKLYAMVDNEEIIMTDLNSEETFVGNDFKRMRCSFVAQDATAKVRFIFKNCRTDSYGYLAGAKCEKNKKVSGWQPNSEDVYQSIKSARSEIKQTDEKITTLVETVNKQGELISSHTTSIEQTDKAITLQAESIKTLNESIESTKAELKVNSDAITSKVWKTDVGEMISDINIDNKNRVLNSDFGDGWELWSETNNLFQLKKIGNYKFAVAERSGLPQNMAIAIATNKFPVKHNERLMFGFYFYCADLSKLDNKIVGALELLDINDIRIDRVDFDVSKLSLGNGSFTKLSNTYFVEDERIVKARLRFFLNRNGNIGFALPMAQAGDIKSSDWSLAPEDVARRFNDTNVTITNYEQTVNGFKQTVESYKGSVDGYSNQVSEFNQTVNGFNQTIKDYKESNDKRVQQLETSLTTESGKIEAVVKESAGTKDELGKLTANGGRISQLELTAQGLKSTVASQTSSIQTIQTDTTNAKQLANDAYNKAQNAVASATNANSTANSAVSTANTAKSNADKAIADVASLTKTVTTQSTRIDQTSNRIEQVASGVTEIGNVINSQQSGGMNLWRFTKEYDGSKYNKWGQIGATNIYYKNWRPVTTVDGFGVQYITTAWDDLSQRVPVKPNTEYTLSAMIRLGSENSKVGFYADNGTRLNILVDGQIQPTQATINGLSATEYKRVSATFNTGNANYSYARFEPQDNSTMYMYQPMLNEGKPKPWSPHPDDTQSQIDDINNNIANNYYQKTTVDSKLSTAVSGITAQYTQDITTRLGNYYDKSTIDSKLTIDGKGIATYVKSTQSQLDNLAIGNENLINLSEIKEYDGATIDTSNYIKRGEVILTKSTAPYCGLYFNFYNDAKPEKYYVLSYDITALDNEPFKTIRGHMDPGFYTMKWYINGVETKKGYPEPYTFSDSSVKKHHIEVYIKVKNEMTTDRRIFIQPNMNGTAREKYKIENLKLVEGNKYTNGWSPAPGDMATLTQYTEVKQLADRISSTVYDSSTGLTTKVNQLAGKYAITALNSAGDILASLNLNANTSTAEINAKLIRLNGSTKMDDAFVNKLVANSIITNKIKATQISGDYIKGGTIDGTIIKSTGPNGTTKLADGWFISTQNNAVGQYGAQSVNMTISDSSGKYAGSTKLTYNGFVNEMKNKDGVFAKRKITFHAEGFKIEPEKTNVGTNLNSGMHLVGRKAYLDFVANTTYRDDKTPYHLRIIANEDGKSFIESTQGRLEIYTKNQEQLVVNAQYIPQTTMDNNMGIKRMVVAKPNESGAYMEVQNRAGKAWGISMWLSDERLKSNITSPTQDALDTLNQLQVRQFDWKSDNVHEDFGLVAQEVEQVLPNAVFKVGDYYQVKDSGLIPVLIGAVQKLSKKVNLLESIIYNTKGGNLL